MTLTEVVLGNIIFLLIPLIFLAYLILSNSQLSSIWSGQIDSNYFLIILFVTWISDYVLTIIVAIFQKRWEYLIVGLVFPLIRFVDGVAFTLAIPRAFLVRSDGRWVSPSRRRESSLGQIPA